MRVKEVGNNSNRHARHLANITGVKAGEGLVVGAGGRGTKSQTGIGNF